MKRSLTIVTAAVLAAGMATSTSASRYGLPYYKEDYDDYRPYCYYKSYGDENDKNVHVLENGTVFVDTSGISEEGSHIYSDLYYKDVHKLTFCFFIKMAYDSDEVYINGMKNGNTKYEDVYKDQDEKFVIVYTKYEEHYPYPQVQISAPTLKLKPLPVKAENTDDYPIGIVDSVVSRDSKPGYYELYVHDYMPESTGSSLVIGYPDENITTKGYNPAYYSLSQTVMISDRALGDVNNDGRVDEHDARCILRMFAADMNATGDEDAVSVDDIDITLTDAEDILVKSIPAADVNGDGTVNSDDAEIIMDYVLDGEGKSFYEYLGI